MSYASESITPSRRLGRTKSVTLPRVIRSEWIKLRTIRSSWLVLGFTLVGIAGIGLLVSKYNAAHWATMSASSRAELNPINQSLIGVNLAELAIGVRGVLFATSEYGTGMIRSTFGAVPRRLPVMAAKASVLGAVTYVVCLAATLIAFLGGQALLGSHGISLGDPGAARAVFGSALYLAVVGIMGVGLGFLIRSPAGGIATLIGLLFVLPVIAASLHKSSLQRFLPSMAGRALFTMTSDHAMLSPWVGFGVFVLYAGIVMAAAAVTVRRRDA
jgi:ABC-2 type transport system permease protein